MLPSPLDVKFVESLSGESKTLGLFLDSNTFIEHFIMAESFDI